MRRVVVKEIFTVIAIDYRPQIPGSPARLKSTNIITKGELSQVIPGSGLIIFIDLTFMVVGPGTATRDGLLMRGEISQSDLNQAEVSVMELADYLAMGEAFINIATLAYPEGEIAGQLMEVDMTPLKRKKTTRK